MGMMFNDMGDNPEVMPPKGLKGPVPEDIGESLTFPECRGYRIHGSGEGRFSTTHGSLSTT